MKTYLKYLGVFILVLLSKSLFAHNSSGMNLNVVRVNDTMYLVKLVKQIPDYNQPLFNLNNPIPISVWTDAGDFRASLTLYPDTIYPSNASSFPQSKLAKSNCGVQITSIGYQLPFINLTGTFIVPNAFRVGQPGFRNRIWNFGLKTDYPVVGLINSLGTDFYTQLKFIDTSTVIVGSTPVRSQIYDCQISKVNSTDYNYGIVDPNGDSITISFENTYSDSVTVNRLYTGYTISTPFLNCQTILSNGFIHFVPNSIIPLGAHVVGLRIEKWRRLPGRTPVLLSQEKVFQDFSISQNPVLYDYQAVQTRQVQSSINLPCGTDSFDIQFDRPIVVSSIASNGSDWALVGAGGRNLPIKSVKAISPSNSQSVPTKLVTTTVRFKLNSRINNLGAYNLYARRGTDGNVFMNVCGGEFQPMQVALILQQASNCPPIGVLTGATKDTITKGNPGARVLWHASAEELQDFQTWVVLKRIGNGPWNPVFQTADISVNQWTDYDSEGEYQVVIATNTGYTVMDKGVKPPQFSPKADGSDLVSWFEVAKKLNQTIEMKNATGKFETVTSVEALNGNVELRLVDNSNSAFKLYSAVTTVSVGLKFNRMVNQDELIQFPTASWIQIFDEFGRLVYKASGNSLQWNSATSGVYFVKSDQYSGTIQVR